MDSCLARRVQNVAHRRVRHSEFYNRCATSSSYHSRLHESDPDVFLRGLWTGRKFHQPEIRRSVHTPPLSAETRLSSSSCRRCCTMSLFRKMHLQSSHPALQPHLSSLLCRV